MTTHATSTRRRRFTATALATLSLAVLATACSSNSASATTTTAPTVSNSGNASQPKGKTIDVGAISTLSGAIAADFDAFVPGVQAYLDSINAKGGVAGYKIKLTQNLDDSSQSSAFTAASHKLVDQSHAFAVFVSSPLFSPNFFVENKVPVYGYNVAGNWQGPPNLFAAGGSVQDYTVGSRPVAMAMKKTGSKSAAVIAYAPLIAPSYDACNAVQKDLKAAGYKVNFVDLSAGLNGTYTSDVQRMQQAGTDFVYTCMQSTDNITLAREISQYGLHIKQLWVNGYDQSLLQKYSSIMKNVYLNLSGNVPFQAPAKFPGTYPGMSAYLAAMKKYEPKFQLSDQALQGWQSAALLAQGIKATVAAGLPVTQANVISQTNKITNFTAGGVTTVTNWTKAHTVSTYPVCTATVQVQGSKFVPVFGQGKKVFVCQSSSLKNLTPVPAPAGTPGG